MTEKHVKQPYNCPRCGYTTHRKDHIKKHLYKLTKQCPAQERDIELTPAIKEYILNNRTYHSSPSSPPTPSQVIHQTFNQNFNNYNQINNLICKMDPLEKINKWISYNHLELEDFEESVSQRYSHQIDKLNSNSFKEFYLDHNNILDVVDKVTHGSKFNVIHDIYSDKLKIYNNGTWNSELFEKGVSDILDTIKITYWDIYENYLTTKYASSISYHDKQYIIEHMQCYYKFLVCFNLKSKCEDFYVHYKDIEENIKMSEVNKIKKQVYEIIRKNSKASILDLNNKMMEILQVDFTNSLLHHNYMHQR